MPASKPQDIRNIALVGHGGSGKTTLGEAMLHAAGVTGRLGSVDDGTSELDYTAIERERQHSVDPTLTYLAHSGKHINFIDTPGYPDFIGGAIASLSGVDTAVVVMSAIAGIEVNARRLMNLARENQMPAAIIVNRIDGENVDLSGLIGQIQESFGSACQPLNLPTGGGSGVIDVFANESGEADFGDVADAHMQIIESVIESDEALMEAYLGGEDVPAEKLSSAFASAMVAGTVIPILFTAAESEVGVKEFMDAVVNYFPSPADVALKPARSAAESTEEQPAEEIPLSADADKPFVGQAFKITADPYVGKMSWIRILQGTVTPETSFCLRDDRRAMKLSHPFKVQCKQTDEISKAVAGDIVALSKVEEIETGDVLHEQPQPVFRPMLPTPTPMFSMAVMPKSRGDEQKISQALHRLSEEDPTFTTTRDAQTNETVISGIGDLHLRIMLTKMSSRFELEVETKPPKIPYRETITAKAEGHHRHKKQTGGAGQFGEVFLRVEPLERGEGFDFVNDLFGESIPRQFLPAIEKGVQEVMQNGAIAGYPMQDVRVSIYDGKHHPVDSKEVAFKSAGKYAFLDAVQKAKPTLLEPMVELEVTTPAEHMGDIASDLSGRRGRISGQDMLPGNMCVVRATAPLSEVMQYNSQLRSITGGQGSYTMEFSHYEPVPGNVQQQVIEQSKKTEQEEE